MKPTVTQATNDDGVVDALAGLIGWAQMLLSQDDMPPELRARFSNSHRLTTAVLALAARPDAGARQESAVRWQWQPIETAHRSGKAVLVYEPGFRGGVFKAHLVRLMKGNDEWVTHGALHKLRPTHWMPLPDGPDAPTP